ncbi:uncharacterized protein LOC114535291 [Dendronephthya gigantea]|uniref:uncharacterized protein LOC114535291 n=1 Tax=Dendronephthya gigantea TaxID=151771 RepID=UPI0010694ACA|nr:uncharacterized protein LOC114535291 [Dendronephthya gigantea]
MLAKTFLLLCGIHAAFCAAEWRTVGYGCVGARDTKFLALRYTGQSGFVSAFRMTHTSGKLGCYQAAQSNWGCNHQGLNMFVTDTENTIMYPSPVLTKPYKAGGWYRLPGYYHNSPQLVLSDVGTRFIYQNQAIRIWYGEDLYDYTESDNHGKTCFKAHFYFVN